MAISYYTHTSTYAVGIKSSYTQTVPPNIYDTAYIDRFYTPATTTAVKHFCFVYAHTTALYDLWAARHSVRVDSQIFVLQ